MKLPRLPIRKSLIPYEDLGIQDVSPDNQMLGDDISIIIAAIEAMGKHGTRMLQVDDNGFLLTNPVSQGSYKYGGKKLVFGPYHLTDTDSATPDIDLSEFSMVLFEVTISNYNGVGSTLDVRLCWRDSLDNIVDITTLGSQQANSTVRYGIWDQYNNFLYIDRMCINMDGMTAASSLDLLITVYGR